MVAPGHFDTIGVGLGNKPILKAFNSHSDGSPGRYGINPVAITNIVYLDYRFKVVIEAIAAGRQAAISIDKYLGGSGDIDEVLAPPEEETLAPLEETEEKRRPEMPTLPVEQRLGDFSQVELGYSDQMAIEEAMRCLRCDLEERD